MGEGETEKKNRCGFNDICFCFPVNRDYMYKFAEKEVFLRKCYEILQQSVENFNVKKK